MKYITAELSVAGGRKENQDACGFLEKPPFYCWVVADGLGGHRGGEIASRLAVESVLKTFKDIPEVSTQVLLQYIEAAQTSILSRQEEDVALRAMRTTLVILIAGPKGAMWAHVGDSRLYHFSGGRIIFQTMDHSVSQAMVNAGEITAEEIRSHEDRNRLLRALGNKRDVRPAVEKKIHTVKPGDTFLLCTDGFWEYVLETEMAVDLVCSENPTNWLELMAERIADRGSGAFDNYSGIGIFIDP
nr:protein phosphatase 2C domain-containing protein [uncultured Desulfobacter sp.]